MMAAVFAARSGNEVTLLEKNEKCGKKLYITGKGRCNFTNACEPGDFLDNVVENPRFLHSALHSFTPGDMMDFLRENGCPVKVERGRRAFPSSDKASDVTKALVHAMERAHVRIRYGFRVKELILREKKVLGVFSDRGEELAADHVIVATGGLSYPSTGSKGEGFLLAAQAGIGVTPLFPSLVPFETKEKWPARLQGLALKNVVLSAPEGKKGFSAQGELLFTHFGISGPLVLSASAYLAGKEEGKRLFIDLKPALSPETLEERLIREFTLTPGKSVKNAFGTLFPKAMVPVMVSLCGIEGEKKAARVSAEERKRLRELIKAVPLTISRSRGFEEAVVTRGGVELKAIDPKTMKVKGMEGLSFCGEVLDVDALTGGYNLQIAWSTGAAAGRSV